MRREQGAGPQDLPVAGDGVRGKKNGCIPAARAPASAAIRGPSAPSMR